jgi:hypothetical protein
MASVFDAAMTAGKSSFSQRQMKVGPEGKPCWYVDNNASDLTKTETTLRQLTASV